METMQKRMGFRAKADKSYGFDCVMLQVWESTLKVKYNWETSGQQKKKLTGAAAWLLTALVLG